MTYSVRHRGTQGVKMQFSDKVARGCWSSADSMKSSTFWEVKASTQYFFQRSKGEGGASN